MRKTILLRGIAALLLVLLLCCSVSCGNTTPTEQGSTAASTTVAPEVTEDNIDPKLPAVDWNGEEFGILYNGSTLEPNLDFTAEETNGAALNDAVYNRNVFIQEKYNLAIRSEYKSDSAIQTSVQTATASGDTMYHLTEANQTYTMTMALKGFLYDIDELTNVNTSKPYWFSSALPGSSVDGRNYFAYSDANVHAFGATPCAIFNKTVLADFTSLPDIYTLVADKQWTIAAMSEMVKTVTADIDGVNGISEKDRLGMIANTFSIDCFISGTGYQLIIKDENDLPYVNYNTEQFINIVESIQSLCSAENGMFLCDRFSTSNEARNYWPEYAITENRALFWIGNFKCVERLRASDADFGVAPMPMADLNQEGYKSHMQANIGAAMSVPTCVMEDDLENVSSVLEDIAYQSSLTVMPTYFEVLIEGQSIRDIQSLESIRIIRNSYYCDMGFMLGNYGVNILNSMRSVVKDNSPVASKIQSESKSHERLLTKLRTDLGY